MTRLTNSIRCMLHIRQIYDKANFRKNLMNIINLTKDINVKQQTSFRRRSSAINAG